MRCAVVAAALVLSGCAGVDRDEYVEANIEILDELPVYPGARVATTSSSACRSSDTPFARTTGYYTSRRYALPRGAEPDRVIAFFEQNATGWEPRDESTAPSVNLVRGDDFAHVLAGRGHYVIGVDHSAPGCPGP